MKHILAWYHYDFERNTGVRVPVTEPKADLYLTAAERQRMIQGRYWVIMAGGKLDLTNKHWHIQRYQEVVNRLHPYGFRFVQCGATHSKHVHPPLDNCLNMVGKTDNVRDLFNIILHSEGVIGPVTGAMHIAAAFDKPCVVVAGGREEPWFEAYIDGFEAFGKSCSSIKVPHKFLHTIGKMYCCDVQGCWKKRVVPIEPEDLGKNANTICREPVRPSKGNQAVPGCMDLIQTEHVVEAIMDYYNEKILPPIGKIKGTVPPLQHPVEATTVLLNPQTFEDIKQLDMNAPPPTIRIPTIEVQKAQDVTNKPTDLSNTTAGLAPPPIIQISTAEPMIIRAPQIVREQREHQKVHPAEYGMAGPKRIDTSMMDNSIIGGKYTVCVLCYGPHTDLAKRCLTTLMESIPIERLDLRVATNQVAQKTIEFLRGLPLTKLYINEQNRKKYPVMREMFWDPRHPIRTNYLCWFDDDAYVVDPQWWKRLAEAIIANHKHGVRLYGARMFHDLQMYQKAGHDPTRWFRTGAWNRGVNFRVRNQEKYAPNGSVIDFCAGWFWCMGTDAIKAADIPDARLNHNGGDVTIGEQIHQAGYKMKMFNKGKVFISCPSKEQGGRRGYEENFPWAPK